MTFVWLGIGVLLACTIGYYLLKTICKIIIDAAFRAL